MSKSTTLSFRPDGTMVGLWTEAINLHAFGPLQIQRASNIEFDNATERWTVEIEGTILFSDPSRDRCLQWEHDYFENRLSGS